MSAGVVPSIGTLGDGSSGGSGVSLSADVPINGVPPDAGNRSIVCNGSGGILAPGTKQLLNVDIASAGGFTYEAWFKWNGNGDLNSIIDYAGTEQLRRRTADSGVAMRSSDGGSSITIGPAPSNTWVYAAAVFTPTGPVAEDGSITGDYVFYLDGNAPVLTVTNVTITSFGDSLNRTIGVGMHPQGSASDFFHGLIYEPRVTLGGLPGPSLLFKSGVITVTTAADEDDGFLGGGAGVSLREAVHYAQNGSLIRFSSSLSGAIITLVNGALPIDKKLTIDASSLALGITIDGNHASRIFYVGSDSLDPQVALAGLTLANGQAGSDSLMMSQDFNASDGGFTVQNGDSWSMWTYNSGSWKASAAEPCGDPKFSYLTSPGIEVTNTGSIRLRFNHRYSFEDATTFSDGGQIELSVNGGAFVRVPAEAFVANGYAGTITGNNVLKNQQCFAGVSDGYGSGSFITSEADLGLFSAGDTIRVRFTGAWDECITMGDPSWEIDSVVLDQKDFSIGRGGAIYNSGNLTVINCTFANNIIHGNDGESRSEASTSGGGGGGGAGMGGAIYSDGSALSVSNCFFTGNAAFGGNGGNGGGNQIGDARGGNGGGPNSGLGGNNDESGNAGGFSGGGGGGGTGTGTTDNGGPGGFGGGGGGAGARTSGSSGGNGGAGGLYGGAGGTSCCSFAAGGGGGAGLGGAIFARTGTVTIANCSFANNQATNGVGGTGSFGSGTGVAGMGLGGAVCLNTTNVTVLGNAFSGNQASTAGADLVSAGTLVVTTNSDSGPGSLRQTVQDSASIPGESTILFVPALSGQTITLTSGTIEVSNSVAVDASALADRVLINGNGTSRVFYVTNGSSAVLNSLTITNGLAPSGGLADDGRGGGIFCRGRVDLLNCSIVNCVASDYAGAIACDHGEIHLTACSLSGNSANYGGGAIFNYFGTMTVTNSTLSGNSANGYGGGIYNISDTMTLNNSTLSGNSAEYGGGIYNISGTLSLNNSTLSGNAANAGGGGAIDNGGGSLIMTACLLAGNTAATVVGPDLWQEDGTLTATDCLISDGPSSTLTNGVNSNLVGNGSTPIDALLAPLGNYGGPTQTMPPLPGSPAIDAASVIAGLTTDQRGAPRPVDGNGDASVLPDIGAVEYQPVIVSNNNDSGAGSLRAAVDSPFTTVVRFDPALAGQTITLTNGQLLASKNLTIDASALPGGIRIDGNGTSRVFSVTNGSSAVLNSLTITNGFAPSGDFSVNGGGGGIFCRRSRVDLLNCSIVNCSSGTPGGLPQLGGAITCDYGEVHLTACTLSGNSAYGGGGIYNSGTLTINNSTLKDNSASSGGGISSLGGTIGLTNVTLVGNSAFAGGAFYNNTSMAVLTHCTLAQNQSTGTNMLYAGGGAIQNDSAPLTLIACILAGNTAATGTGPDLWMDSGTLTANNCLIGNFIDSTIVDGVNFNLAGTGSSPLDAMLAPLGDYGGPTETMPPRPGSPAIDKGGVTALTTDQRGYPRPVGLAADIGAVEVSIVSNPCRITGVIRLGDGSVQFGFTNLSGSMFSVRASTNVALPLNQWSNLGPVTEMPPGSGQFQFTDVQATNHSHRYYRVSSL